MKVTLVCPNCQSVLKMPDYWCSNCRVKYPVIRKIPLLFSKSDFGKYRSSKDTPQEYYRLAAKVFEKTHHVSMPGGKLFLKEYQNKVEPYLKAAKEVLEIGAGTGFATNVIKGYVKSLVISDATLEMLLLNKSDNRICASVENLPFKNESFDLVLGNNVFYLVPDKKVGAGSIAKTLKKGGRLILSEMNPYFLLWPIMFSSTGRFFERSVYGITLPKMVKYFKPFGMKLEKVEYYSYTPYFAGKNLIKLGARLERLFKGNPVNKFFAIRVLYIFRKI